jgi:hypothetical protein
MSGRWRPGRCRTPRDCLAMNAHNLDAMVACFAGGRDDDDPKGLRVAEFAAAVGVGADTSRFYEKMGLLLAPARTPAGYRAYVASAVDRLQLIWMTSRFKSRQHQPVSPRPLRRKSCIGGQDLGIFPTEPGISHESCDRAAGCPGGRPRIILSNRLALAVTCSAVDSFASRMADVP